MSKSDTETLERPAQHPVATILRSRGFVPLPRLWVRSKDMPTIHLIAEQYREEVNAVRAQAGAEEHAQHQTEQATTKAAAANGRGTNQDADPRNEKDAAWEAAERLRSVG